MDQWEEISELRKALIDERAKAAELAREVERLNRVAGNMRAEIAALVGELNGTVSETRAVN